MATRVAECGADAGKLTSAYEYVDGGYGTNSTHAAGEEDYSEWHLIRI